MSAHEPADDRDCEIRRLQSIVRNQLGQEKEYQERLRLEKAERDDLNHQIRLLDDTRSLLTVECATWKAKFEDQESRWLAAYNKDTSELRDDKCLLEADNERLRAELEGRGLSESKELELRGIAEGYEHELTELREAVELFVRFWNRLRKDDVIYDGALNPLRAVLAKLRPSAADALVGQEPDQ